VIVHSPFDRRDENRPHTGFGQTIKGLQLGLD